MWNEYFKKDWCTAVKINGITILHLWHTVVGTSANWSQFWLPHCGHQQCEVLRATMLRDSHVEDSRRKGSLSSQVCQNLMTDLDTWINNYNGSKMFRAIIRAYY